MTEHPITPPPGLVQQWMAEVWHEGTPVRVAASDLHIATQAARWGADQELEACCEWLHSKGSPNAPRLRTARRPQPPSLKEQALAALKSAPTPSCPNQMRMLTPQQHDLIRLVLEALPE